MKTALKCSPVKVAVDRTSPHGLVVGIDVIPAQPPAGVSTIQGNFLSAAVQDAVKLFLRGAQPGMSRRQTSLSSDPRNGLMIKSELASAGESHLEQGKQSGVFAPEIPGGFRESTSREDNDDHGDKGTMVDVVLSDMSAPWEQTEGFWKRSLSNPYYRMMNTSGVKLRDHAGSMVCHMIQRSYFELSWIT